MGDAVSLLAVLEWPRACTTTILRIVLIRRRQRFLQCFLLVQLHCCMARGSQPTLALCGASLACFVPRARARRIIHIAKTELTLACLCIHISSDHVSVSCPCSPTSRARGS